MHECKNCELIGYSKEFCDFHEKNLTYINKIVEKQPPVIVKHLNKVPDYGMKTLVGVGAGALAIGVGVAALPAIGLTVLAGSLAVKATTGVIAGSAGSYLYNNKKK